VKRSFFIFTSGIWILVSGFSHAILDTNNNGLSDFWEKQNNSNNLFGPSFDPQADPDSDGWTNTQEAAAGTNPFDANPPDGLIQPIISHIPAVMGEDNGTPVLITPQAVTVSWPTLVGKQYTLLFSYTLMTGSWIVVGTPFIATGGDVTYGFEINDSDKRFWRVAVTDVDTDGDGLANREEYLAGSDPALVDTDGDSYSDLEEVADGRDPNFADADYDGMEDRWEIAHGLDPENSEDIFDDPDGDGIVNQFEYVLGYHPTVADPSALTVDRDEDGMSDLWEAQTGTFEWSDELDQYVFVRNLDWQNPADASQDLDSDGLSNFVEYQNNTDPANYDTDYDYLPDGWEIQHGIIAARQVQVNGIWIFGYQGLNGRTGDPDSDGIQNQYEYVLGLDPMLANSAQTDGDSDGMPDHWEAQNGTFQRSYASRRYEFQRKLDWENPADASQDLDSDGLSNLAEYQNNTDPANYDTDGDYLPDLWEIQHGLVASYRIQVGGSWIYGSNGVEGRAGDPDADGIQNQYEYVLGFDPNAADFGQADRDNDGLFDLWEAQTGTFQWSSASQRYDFQRKLDWQNPADASQDLDSDDLANSAEAQIGTNPFDPDTDNDHMPDGWEVQNHGKTVNRTLGGTASPGSGTMPSPSTVQLSPLDAADASLDPDQDGLTNLQEYLNGTRPEADDSDSDGGSDGSEVQSGANPNNSSNAGQPPPPEEMVDLPFSANGDYALWEMTVTGKGPEDERVQKIITTQFSQTETKSLKLRKGNTYEVSMRHIKTKPNVQPETWWCWEAKVDGLPTVATYQSYNSTRIPNAATAFIVGGNWLVDNRDGMLSAHVHMKQGDGSNIAGTKTARLVPVEIEEVISDQIAGNEANKLPTAFYGQNPNNPMLMATRTGKDARLIVKMNVPAAHAASIRVGVRQKGQMTILNSAASVAPPGKTPLSFTALDGTKTYEVVAGYDANSDTILDHSEATVTFQKTPKTEPDGSPYRGGDSSYNFIDKILIVTEDDYVSARNWTESYKTTLAASHPTGSDLMGMFAAGGTTVPGVSSTDWGQLLDANVIPSLQGLSHPLGAKWNAINQANTFKLVFPFTSPISGKLHQSNGITILRDRLIMKIKDNLRSTATNTEQTSYPIPFEDDQINFEGSDLRSDLHLALGKCRAEGTITVKYRLNIDGSLLDIKECKIDGYVTDLYDWAYGTSLVLPVLGQIDLTKDAARTQAGHATLTNAAAPNAGRVSFTNVEIKTGWRLVGNTY